jgi:hypothetical protein
VAGRGRARASGRERLPASTVRVVSRSTLSGMAFGECVEVEPADVGVELVLDDHASGVAGVAGFGRGHHLVGDEQGGFEADVRDSSPTRDVRQDAELARQEPVNRG